MRMMKEKKMEKKKRPVSIWFQEFRNTENALR
jgi:hypothetical protein